VLDLLLGVKHAGGSSSSMVMTSSPAPGLAGVRGVLFAVKFELLREVLA
jgi:hypothetical protein